MPLSPSLSLSYQIFLPPRGNLLTSLGYAAASEDVSHSAFCFPAWSHRLMKSLLVGFDNHPGDHFSFRRSAFLSDRSPLGVILLIAENTWSRRKPRSASTNRFALP